MLNKIVDFFKSEAQSHKSGQHDERELHIAAAAMLIEAAMTDGQVDSVERERIGVLIERHFGVSRTDVEQILVESEAKAEAAVDIYSFLRVVNEHFDHDERIALVEMLWDVVYADGELHDHEANLIRRVSSMLGLTDIESGEARKRVLARRENGVEDSDALHPVGNSG
ncbi:MAG: TerB family tellurite resistance protein [Alphaproteobacteria bacterium]|nr:TerB family tellurite resistance protein [Alphaproteobacteria bacterium]